MHRQQKARPIKGSCKKIPCTWAGESCSCKDYCKNCCGKIDNCYNSHNYKVFIQKWAEIKKNSKCTQLNLFE